MVEGKLISPLRADAGVTGGASLCWSLTPRDGKAPVSEHLGLDRLDVDDILLTLLELEMAGEDTAVKGWLGVYADRFEGRDGVEIGLTCLDVDFDGGPVKEALGRMGRAMKEAKEAKEALERLVLLDAAGMSDVVGMKAAKLKLTVTEAEKKSAKERVKLCWVEVRTFLNYRLSLIWTRESWSVWLKGRGVRIDEEGRLTLGGRVVTSGAETWLTRLVTVAALKRRGAYCLATIEDRPFDDRTMLTWPTEMTSGELGVQVIITAADSWRDGRLGFEVTDGFGVVRTPLSAGSWLV